jgi:hypothetical protein
MAYHGVTQKSVDLPGWDFRETPMMLTLKVLPKVGPNRILCHCPSPGNRRTNENQRYTGKCEQC